MIIPHCCLGSWVVGDNEEVKKKWFHQIIAIIFDCQLNDQLQQSATSIGIISTIRVVHNQV